MRVLWLSPWMRPLARVHTAALRAAGVPTMLVTSAQHPQPLDPDPDEVVLVPRVRDAGSWRPFGQALAAARRFGPDVVVAELVRDPRWLAFGRLGPVVQVVHDDRPHDAAERPPAWERALFGRWAARAAGRVAFSRFVADRLPPGPPVTVVPLTSDLPSGDVPVAGDAHDFLVVGRINGYKNLAVTFRAWSRHVAGPAHRGDQLVIVGAGALPGPLPPHARWTATAFSYADVLPALAAAKASVVHYRQASQSGAQVLAMQLGVAPIASDAGALPEYQPPGAPIVGAGDVAGLAAAFDRLADPAVAARLGSSARAHFEANHSPQRAAAALLTALRAAAG